MTEEPSPPGRRPRHALAVLLAYLVLAAAFAKDLLPDPLHRTLGGGGGDASLFLWFLAHTSTSLLHEHGQGLLVTHALNAPDGVNMMWNTGLLLPGAVLAPVTALAGPVLTLNLLILLGPALTAWSAYLCSGRFLTRTSARAVTGLFAGFSPAMMAAALGHFQLTLLMLVPPLLLVSVDAMTGRRGPVRSGLLIGSLVACQLLIGEEVLALTAVAVTVLLLVLAAQHRSRVVERLVPFLRTAATAAATALVLVGLPLWVQFFGPQRVQGDVQTPDVQVLDPAQLLLPTRQLLHRVPYDQLLHATELAPSETMGYLGLPLLVLLGFVLWTHRQDVVARTAGLTAAVLTVLALGFTLHLGGHHTGIPVPWRVAASLPAVGSLVPVRWLLLVDLLVALLLGLALEAAPRTGSRRWMVPVLIVLALSPVLPEPLGGVHVVRTPSFFRNEATHLRDTALVVPVPTPRDARAMVWVAEAGSRFPIPGGYFVGPGPHRHPVFGTYPQRRLALALTHLSAFGGTIPVTPALRARAREDLRYWGATTVVLGPSRYEEACLVFLTELLGRRPVSTGGVWLWRAVDPSQV